MFNNKILIFLFFIFSLGVFAQTPAPQTAFSTGKVDAAEAEKWREDLRFMQREMPKYHANLFHTITREQFDEEIKKLDQRIPDLARHQIIVEMMRITALINDGHSNVYPTRDAKIGFRQFPVKMYFFKDGLYVRAATNENANLVGAKVTKIGSATTEQARRAVLEIIGKDNEMGALFFAPHLLAMPEILHALKLSDNPDFAEFTFETNGKQSVVRLRPMGLADIMSGDTDKTLALKDGWTDWRGGSENNPKTLWLKNINDKFWYEYLPESKTVYVQFNEVYDKSDETIEAFAKRLFDFVEKNTVEKFVLDVRHNRGGNGQLNKPLLLGLIKSKINRRGKLFAVIGRSSFSATQFLIDDLEKYTDAIFVGEPSGSNGKTYGDSRRITLPNSKMTVRVSVYYWQDWHPADTRRWVAPELTAELSSADYRINNDPAIKTILDYTTRKTLAEILSDALTAGGINLAAEKYKEFKADPVNKFAYTEMTLLEAGEHLLIEKKPEQAAALFQIAAEDYPNSFHAFFALGTAYASAGKRELALENLEKALRLNPKSYELNQRYSQLKAGK